MSSTRSRDFEVWSKRQPHDCIITPPLPGVANNQLVSEIFETKCSASNARPIPSEFIWLLDGKEVTNPRAGIFEEPKVDEYGYHTVSEIFEYTFSQVKSYDLECRAHQGIDGYYGRARVEVQVVKNVSGATVSSATTGEVIKNG